MNAGLSKNDFLTDLRSEVVMANDLESITEFLDDSCVWKGSLSLMDDHEGEFNWIRMPGFELVALDDRAKSLQLPVTEAGLSVAAKRRTALTKVRRKTNNDNLCIFFGFENMHP